MTTTGGGPTAGPEGGISGALVVLLAVSCGIAVANLYYAQPLLHAIARSYHAGSGPTGLLITSTQVGYALGLGFVVPLGDLVNRRRLVAVLLGGTSAAMVASAFAPWLAVLIALSLLVGIGSAAAQVLVPMAAQLAAPAERGRVVGQVMSGLLLGILLARTASGFIAGASSWRVVYLIGAVLAALLAAVLYRFLPRDGERSQLGYPALLASAVRLFATEGVLRRRALLGALAFGAFSVFWTTVAFMLAGPPYHYRPTIIGLFGLVGAAGALCANFAGRIVDRGRARASTITFAVLVGGSFVPIYLGHHSLALLIVGIVALDIGAQGMQVTNQGLIYALAPEARSRVNSAYMVVYFIGGAIGSAVAGVDYGRFGWAGVCVLGGAIGVAACGVWTFDRFSPVRQGRPSAALSAEPA